MIIIEKDKPWPQDLQMDCGAGCRVAKDVPVTQVVADSISSYWQRFGCRPTHIVIPLRFRNLIAQQFYELVPFPKQSGDLEDFQIMGLKLVWTTGGAMEILGDPDHP